VQMPGGPWMARVPRSRGRRRRSARSVSRHVETRGAVSGRDRDAVTGHDAATDLNGRRGMRGGSKISAWPPLTLRCALKRDDVTGDFIPQQIRQSHQGRTWPIVHDGEESGRNDETENQGREDRRASRDGLRSENGRGRPEGHRRLRLRSMEPGHRRADRQARAASFVSAALRAFTARVIQPTPGRLSRSSGSCAPSGSARTRKEW
jgi:hypothetical protein